MLVGNNFLMLSDLVIDCATKTVHQHGLFGLTEKLKNYSHKLVSCDNVRVPPWHVAWVKCEVSLPRNFVMSLERDVLIEPNVRLAKQNFLHGSNALVRTHDNVCYVSVANFSNISQTIPVGCTLADVVPIDIVEVTPPPDSTHQKFEQQLSQLKTGDLSGDQKQRLLSLLRKYPTCFPTDVRPIGRISKVEHTLDTRGILPISQHAYRRSWSKRLYMVPLDFAQISGN